jgi:hypothetical protein
MVLADSGKDTAQLIHPPRFSLKNLSTGDFSHA